MNISNVTRVYKTVLLHFSNAVKLTLCLEPEVRMARSQTKICMHKFACTNVTPKIKERKKKNKRLQIAYTQVQA